MEVNLSIIQRELLLSNTSLLLFRVLFFLSFLEQDRHKNRKMSQLLKIQNVYLVWINRNLLTLHDLLNLKLYCQVSNL
jgi:hypothetical protein